MNWNTPSSTARDERRPAIELENACKESYANVSPRINSPAKRSSDIDLVSNNKQKLSAHAAISENADHALQFPGETTHSR